MVMRVPSELANDLRDQPDLLEGFSLDEPDWDLALALIAVTRGYVFKQLAVGATNAPASLSALTGTLKRLLVRLSAEPAGHCPDLIQDLLDGSGSARLTRTAVLDRLG